jgi:hypothetical protein
MNDFIRIFVSVFPVLILPVYFENYHDWGTNKKRKMVGIALGLLWSVAFGWFTGATGFLRT